MTWTAIVAVFGICLIVATLTWWAPRKPPTAVPPDPPRPEIERLVFPGDLVAHPLPAGVRLMATVACGPPVDGCVLDVRIWDSIMDPQLAEEVFSLRAIRGARNFRADLQDPAYLILRRDRNGPADPSIVQIRLFPLKRNLAGSR